MLLRLLTGLGIGGEWAAGASLVAEVFPDRSRAPAASVLQTAAALGPALAAVANLGLAGQSWRLLFFVGGMPALMTIAIRFK
ncbi:MFS transporter, partial [Salmonella enterica]|uniref:MFS transporter n=1 Tax=Salmonella enterica TaxID=28901 RepID=UPI0032B60FCA